LNLTSPRRALSRKISGSADRKGNSLNVTEIKSWAKKHGFSLRKSGEGYVWSGSSFQEGEPQAIEEVAKAIFNVITGGRFVEHQKNFKGI